MSPMSVVGLLASPRARQSTDQIDLIASSLLGFGLRQLGAGIGSRIL
jgi:hypothetical protein